MRRPGRRLLALAGAAAPTVVVEPSSTDLRKTPGLALPPLYFPSTPQICNVFPPICQVFSPICQVFSPICQVFSQICEICDPFLVRTGSQICNLKSQICEVWRRRVRNFAGRRDPWEIDPQVPFASFSDSSFNCNAFATLGAQGTGSDEIALTRFMGDRSGSSRLH